MDQVLLELKYDFHYTLHLFHNRIQRLPTHEQSLALAWANKLKQASDILEEAQLRNDFLYFLAKNCEEGGLKAPFRDDPPAGPITNIISLLPEVRPKKVRNKEYADKRKAALFDMSADFGNFLSLQPVPRCGAFCYLSVISKESDNTE